MFIFIHIESHSWSLYNDFMTDSSLPFFAPEQNPEDLQQFELLHSIPSLILALDRSFRILYCNAAYCRFVGLSFNELHGRILTDLFPRFASTRSFAAYIEVLRDGNWREVAGQVGGACLHSRIYPTSYGLIAIADDRTELRSAETELQHARDQLQAVLDAIPGMVSWIDSDLRYIGVNRALSETLQRPPDFFIGKYIGFLDSLSDYADFVRNLFLSDRLADSREITSIVDGITRYFLVTAQKYNEGRHVVMASVDITARKHMELDLQITQKQYCAIVEDQSELICRYSVNKRLTFVNGAFCRFFGLDREMLIGKSILDLLPGHDGLIVLQQLRHITLEQQTISFEHRAIMSNGSVCWLSRTDRGLLGAAGSIVEYQSVARDVTARHIAEESLQQANAELEKRVEARTADLNRLNEALSSEIKERIDAETRLKGSLEEKEVLVREVHHRVKNNLQVVYSLLDLQSGLSDDPLVTGVLNESKLRIRAMSMIHDRLYRSRNLSRIRFDTYVATLIDQLRISFGAEMDRIQSRIEIDPVMLGIDAAITIGLIVNELVTNSFKYAFPNHRPGTILISLKHTSEMSLTLTIGDDGQGLPPEIQSPDSGSFGLQLVHLLTQQLNGTLTTDPSPGTTWRIIFPIPNTLEVRSE